MSLISAACCQFLPEFGKTRENIDRICGFVRSIDVDLMVFPELATSGYEIKDREELVGLALDSDNIDSFRQFVKTAEDSDTYIIIGFPENSGDKCYNSSILVEPGGNYHIYRKIHLFDREKLLFEPGDKPPTVIKTALGKIGMMICFDWIFPETARSLALQGAQIIAHPANLVLQYCQRAMFARSVENGVYTMTCNRIGSESRTDRTLTFTGASQVLSPRGETLAQAGVDTEEIIIAEIDPAISDNKMITANNHLFEDRRDGMDLRI